MTQPSALWRVAIPTPVHTLFDYLPPSGWSSSSSPAGIRVRVPFGRGSRIGIVAGTVASSQIQGYRLKRIDEVLDQSPLLPPDLLMLLSWATGYYHHPPGEVYLGALPVLLRRGAEASHKGTRRWRLTAQGREIRPSDLKRAPKQQALLERLAAEPEGMTLDSPDDSAHWRSALRALLDKGWVEIGDDVAAAHRHEPDASVMPGHELNPEQRRAVDAVTDAGPGFNTFLLDGVTGSGKTEVYFGIIAAMLRRDRQVLLLVPEIGLTPQLVSRVRARFPGPLAVLHSGMSARDRLDAWLQAANGSARIVIGTRSAVFTPMPALGAIVVDEEHDSSYKQQDGFRYHARDVAIMRARQGDIPAVLGSATPSLESLHNCAQSRFRHLQLSSRAGEAIAPTIRLIDMRTQKVDHGLSEAMAQVIERHLARDHQVLLFLNRRGYSPTLLCQECGWVADCRRCDAHMIYHRGRQQLRCHHCDARSPVNAFCPQCGNPDLRPLGQGTERVEEILSRRFEGTEILRIDRDSTRGKGAMSRLFEQVRHGRRQILLGTQMLAKGHHFPNVTLAGILDADFGLFGADFRAGERMGQLVVQVAGRAGRAIEPGEVLIQTHYPDHPLLTALLGHDYRSFADRLLAERREAGMPPFRHMALVRAESVHRDAPVRFLERVREQAVDTDCADGVELLGPAPAPMERRAGRYRAQLMLLATRRADLHRMLAAVVPGFDKLGASARVRWSLDVDPVDEY